MRSESQGESEFPVEIDLGRKENIGGLTQASPRGTKTKPRVFYPTLYIENVEGLPPLPKEGCLMVRFRRKSMRVEENMDGEDTAGVTLEIRKLCLPDDMAGEGETLDDAFKLGKGEVADDESDYADDDDDEE